MELSLGDLLDHNDLGLRLLTGDDGARDRRVRGAHSIEITPTRWVPKDWVMLTNGLRLRGRPGEQRQLVAELDAGGQAALGWAVGTVTKHVPKAILDEARQRSFPVFAVPLETAFHQIVSFLSQATAHDDVYELHRVARMTEHLLDALGAAKPVQATVRRLASLLDTDVLLTTGAGDPLGVHTAQAQVYPVRTDAGTRLLVVSPSPEPLERVTRPLVDRAVQQLELLARRDARVVEATHRHGAELLNRCLRGGADHTTPDAEAAALGIDLTRGAVAVTWEGAYETARTLLDAASVPYLLTTHADHPVALAVTTAADLAGIFERHAADLVMGIGTRLESLRGFRTSLASAHAALLTRRPDSRLAGERDLDPLAHLLVTAATAGTLTELRAPLTPLRDKPHLLETLRCWLAVDCDVGKAASRLHVHRNSLRYRLTRVEHLTRLPLTAPRTAANLQLALLADDLYERLPR